MADKAKAPSKLALTGKKIGKYFGDLKTELKKVIWPDRKKLVQSTATVLMICIVAALFVFIIDKVLSGFLGLVGFFPSTAASTGTSTGISYISDSNIFTNESGQESSQISSSQSASATTSTSSASASASGK